MTREYRDQLRHAIDQARRERLRTAPRLEKRRDYNGTWTEERIAAGQRALAALRQAEKRAA